MSFIEIFLVGIGLSMDAFAVAVTNGITCIGIRPKSIIKVGFFFGLFQALMPTIGFFLGMLFADFVKNVDHWIAFLLLFFIGGKMLYDVFFGKEEEESCTIATKALLMQAVATSIDALAVGIGFSVLEGEFNIWSSASVIGITTFVLSIIGVFLGKYVGGKLGKYAQIAGGLILISIGAKILIEHLFF